MPVSFEKDLALSVGTHSVKRVEFLRFGVRI
jgi:hypothetical protein